MNFDELIESQFNEISAFGVNLNRMNDADFELLKKYVDSVQQIIWINDFEQMHTTYLNTFGKNYYGYNDSDLKRLGFGLYSDLIHPDYLNDVHTHLGFFTYNPKEIGKIAFFAKVKDNSYRWTMSCSKGLNYTSKGALRLFLSFVFDIENAIDVSLNGTSNLPVNKRFVEENKHLYNLLSEREIEVLKLIGTALTSKQIAAQMNISPATVDTHRGRIRSKLKAKNSSELIKFALLFHPEII